ncbi:inositol-trisphosphate 3-kinase B isoform X3, partial [Aphis craccivora]
MSIIVWPSGFPVGPRPAKGRSSRMRRASSPAAGSATASAAAALILQTNATSTTTMTTCSTVGRTGLTSAAPGYEQYQKSLLEVPWPHAEYGEASSDDLSSEWDSDVPEPPPNSK